MNLNPSALPVRLSVFVAGFALLFLVETIRPRRAWSAPRGRRVLINGGLAALNTVIVFLLFAAPRATLADYVGERAWGLAPLLGLAGVAEMAAGILVLDFLNYVWHRANHRVRFLWRFHKVHHVDTHVDVTTSLRFHPGEMILSQLVKASWVIVWGPTLVTFAIFEIATSLAAQYHHGNIDWPDRIEPFVRAVNVTPRMHTAHHSATTASLDSNFGTIFPWWDRVLLTYAEPAPRHLEQQGLRWGRDRDLDPAYLLTLPIRPPSAQA
jgi:sterol desaturase/sphingolipid hydroxylase (fatty acid hydroxylase superfamily)